MVKITIDKGKAKEARVSRPLLLSKETIRLFLDHLYFLVPQMDEVHTVGCWLKSTVSPVPERTSFPCRS